MQNLGTIRIRTDAKSLEKMKTNLYWDYLKTLTWKTITLWIVVRLIENITVDIPNTVSISKNILLQVSKFHSTYVWNY